MDINELKKQLIPYWRDIYNLQYGNILKQLFVRIKYRIFRITFLKLLHGQCCRISVNSFFQRKGRQNLRHGKPNKKRKTKSDVREQYGIVRFSKQRFCVERL